MTSSFRTRQATCIGPELARLVRLPGKCPHGLSDQKGQAYLQLACQWLLRQWATTRAAAPINRLSRGRPTGQCFR